MTDLQVLDGTEQVLTVGGMRHVPDGVAEVVIGGDFAPTPAPSPAEPVTEAVTVGGTEPPVVPARQRVTRPVTFVDGNGDERVFQCRPSVPGTLYIGFLRAQRAARKADEEDVDAAMELCDAGMAVLETVVVDYPAFSVWADDPDNNIDFKTLFGFVGGLIRSLAPKA